MSQPTLPLVDHTPHCVARLRYGDGQCECGTASTPPHTGHLPSCPESRGMDGVSVCTCACTCASGSAAVIHHPDCLIYHPTWAELRAAVTAALDATALPEYPMAPAIRDRLLAALRALTP